MIQLFCGKTHQIKKFILHTNYPNHYDFSIYDRCEFQIPVSQNSLKPDLETEELVITPRFVGKTENSAKLGDFLMS